MYSYKMKFIHCIYIFSFGSFILVFFLETGMGRTNPLFTNSGINEKKI